MSYKLDTSENNVFFSQKTDYLKEIVYQNWLYMNTTTHSSVNFKPIDALMFRIKYLGGTTA